MRLQNYIKLDGLITGVELYGIAVAVWSSNEDRLRHDEQLMVDHELGENNNGKNKGNISHSTAASGIIVLTIVPFNDLS